MDFIRILPVEVAERIFNHLDTKSFLECFLVCKKWNKFLGNSLVFRRRFCLDLRRVKYSYYKQDNVVSNMKRLFTSALVYYYPWRNSARRVAMMNEILKRHKIVKICLELSFFECTKSEFLSFFSMFQGSLNELRIQMLNITDDTDGMVENVEANLKSLKSIEIIQGANGDFMFDLIKNAKNLRSIKLGGSQLYDNVNELKVCNILMHQRNITSLHMDFEWSEILFRNEDRLLEYPFMLKELVMFVDVADLKNVRKFLQKQSSIQVLHINVYKGAPIDFEFTKQLLKMDMLSSLRLTASGLEEMTEKDGELPISRLKDVKFGSKFYESITPKTLKKILFAMPQVKFITILLSKVISVQNILEDLKENET
jgi:hypothetical protein